MQKDDEIKDDIKKLREEVIELRKVVNLILGIMMEEEEEGESDIEQRDNSIYKLYN